MKTQLKISIAILLLVALSSFQIIKTQIAITVRNEVGNTEAGVKIMLFETEDDYVKETNVVAEGETDDKGVVKFKELKATSYFVIARKGDKDNSGGGEKIGTLQANRINKVTIVIQ
ncbi:MAG TPA: hypothetical protein PLJ60_13685 [Chryseolinea sp.]|nr:hypothetical protein [Chryseolinea sp.]HPH46212.1 hypothetical protein [Chryseolinea sp.]HPM31381.1 hypothetical protein [Chryseolinea sp.]